MDILEKTHIFQYSTFPIMEKWLEKLINCAKMDKLSSFIKEKILPIFIGDQKLFMNFWFMALNRQGKL